MKSSRHPFAIYLFALSALLLCMPALSGAATFTGPELLARPTDTSVTVNVVSDTALQLYFEYGITAGVYTDSTDTVTSTANEPKVVVIDGLEPNTTYYYRMVYSSDNGSTWVQRDGHSFRTQRPPGSTFTFTITSDSHVNIQLGNAGNWTQTLSNIAANQPDFHIDLGDTFAMDNGSTGVTTVEGARSVYLFQRSTSALGRISHSVPIFLAPGNHENEEGWNFDDSPSQALLSINARKRYYPNPIPDSFYSANTDTLAALDGPDKHREDYYAWTWGDALFVVIDPFQYTMTIPYSPFAGELNNEGTPTNDRWTWTLGQQQFNWLKQTLENSNAKYKFIFAHHMVGGSQNYVRGGAVPANMFEWGGYNSNGTTWGFDTKRPGWGDAPIHQMMVANHVSAFFHGHDHEYAYEVRDGVVYQSLPAASFSAGFGIYDENDPLTIEVLPGPGHLRVTVAPSQSTVDYIATSGGGVNYSYTIASGAPVTQHNLTLAADPAGGGSTSPAAGVHAYNEGSVVAVTATPASGYAFNNWSGACTGSGACQVTMDADKSVTAHFTAYVPRTISYIGDIAADSVKEAGPPIPAAFEITTTAAAAAGDTIVVAYASDPNENLSVQVTDSAGNAYTEAARTRNYGNGRTYLFAAYNIKALPAGSTITITSSDSSGGDLPVAKAAVASVFRGLASVNALDQTAVNPPYETTTATDPSSTPSVGPTAATTQEDELIVAAIGTNGPEEDAAGTWQNGFVAGERVGTTGGADPESNWTISLGYRIVSDLGQYSAGKTGITSRRWASVLATFKAGLATTTLEGDLQPGSGDCDVDGSDLAALIANPSQVALATFAGNFGKSACP